MDTEDKAVFGKDKPKAKRKALPKGFFIVNPSGCVHSVTRSHAKMRLAQVGYRLATEDETRAYFAQRVQRFKAPIAAPWSPDPGDPGDPGDVN